MSCNASTVLVGRPVYSHPDDNETVVADFTGRLPDGVKITSGTVTQTLANGDASSDLTVGTPAPNTAVASVDGRDVAVGKGLLFTVTGGVDGTEYRLSCECQCDDGATRVAVLRYIVDDGLEQ